MKIATSIKLCLPIVLLLCANLAHAGNMLFTDHPLVGKIWDMNSSSFIDEATLLDRINTANVLLLGETHDNTQHHELPQKVLKARIESGERPALMMEQLNFENQAEYDRALAGSNRDDVLNNLKRMISFDIWPSYSPLLTIAIDNKLPLIAANIPVRQLQPVMMAGFIAYDANEIKRLAVEEVWNERRQKYLATKMGGAHCGQLRDKLREGLTLIRRLNDAYMADSAVSNVERGVVAIVDRDRARRDIGLPLYFAARAPSARIISIGFTEVSPEKTDPGDYEIERAEGDIPYDLIWFTPRAERTNPCENFKAPNGPQP